MTASRLAILGAVALGVPLMAAASDKPLRQAQNKPNMIVIVTDDMGCADVRFNGCKDNRIPNIDRITKAGARCTSGYVGYSVCGPSRAAQSNLPA